MTPSVILLSLCISLFVALGIVLASYLIRQALKKEIAVPMKVSGKRKPVKKEIALPSSASPSVEEASYEYARAR